MSIRKPSYKRKSKKNKSNSPSRNSAYSRAETDKLTKTDNIKKFGKFVDDPNEPFKFDPNDPRVIRTMRQVATLKNLTVFGDRGMVLDSTGLSVSTYELGVDLEDKYRDLYQGKEGEETYIGDKNNAVSFEDYDKATDIINFHKEQLFDFNDPLIQYDERIDIRLDRRGTPKGSKNQPAIREVAKRRKTGITVSTNSIKGKSTRGKELRLYDDNGKVAVENGNKFTFYKTARNRASNPLNTNELRDEYDLQWDGGVINYFDDDDAQRFLQDFIKNRGQFSKIGNVTLSPEIAKRLGLSIEDGIIVVTDEKIFNEIIEKENKKNRVINTVDTTNFRNMEWATSLTLDENNDRIVFDRNRGFNSHIRPLLQELGIEIKKGDTITKADFHIFMKHMQSTNFQKKVRDGRLMDALIVIPPEDMKILGVDEFGILSELSQQQVAKELEAHKKAKEKSEKVNAVLIQNKSVVRIRDSPSWINGEPHLKKAKAFNKYTGKEEDVIILDGKLRPTTFIELVNRQGNYEGAKISKDDKWQGKTILSKEEAQKLIIDVQNKNVDGGISKISVDSATMKFLQLDSKGKLKTPAKLKQYEELAKIRPTEKSKIDIVYHENGYFEIRGTNNDIEDKVHKIIYDTFSYDKEVWDQNEKEKVTKTFSLLSKHPRGGGLVYMLGGGKIDETKEKLENAIGFDVTIHDPRPKAKRGEVVPLRIATPRDYQETAVEESLEAGRGVIVMGTGAGKTVTASKLIGDYGKGNDVIFFAHNQFLLGQAKSELSKFLGVKVGSTVDFDPNKPATWDDALVPSDQTSNTPKNQQKLNINVVSVQSANDALSSDDAGNKLPKGKGALKKRKEVRKLLEGAEIVILDETHHLKDKNTFQQTLEQINTQTKFGLCIADDTYIIGSNGFERIGELYQTSQQESYISLEKEIETFDFNGFYRTSTSEIYQRKNTPIKQIKTKLGLSLKATPHHRIIIIENGKLIWKHMQDIKLGDKVAIRIGSNIFPTNTEFSEFTYGNYLIPPMKQTEELGYLMGILTGDGSMRLERTVRFHTTNIMLQNRFISICKKLYGITPLITTSDRLVGRYQPTPDIRAHSKVMLEHLKYLGMLPKLSYEKEVPWSVLQGTELMQSSFIKGLFDADGGITYQTKIIEYTTTSQIMVSQIQLMLLNFGIVSTLSIRKSKPCFNDKYISKQQYRLFISEFNSLEEFYHRIGFSHPNKARLLKRILKHKTKTKRRYTTRLIPVRSIVKKLIKSIPITFRKKNHLTIGRHTKIGNINLSSIFTSRESGISPYTLSSILNNLVEKYPQIVEHPNYKDMKNLASGDILFTSVIDINDGIEDVLDFVVPQTHSFVANGFINHNTATPARNDDPKILQIHSVLGRELVNFDSSWLINNEYLVPPEIYWVKAPTNSQAYNFVKGAPIKRKNGKIGRMSPLDVYRERKRVQVVENEPRHKMIVDITKDLADNGNTVLVFVQEVRHGQELATMLRKKTGRNVPFLNGQTLVDSEGKRTDTTDAKNVEQRNRLVVEKVKNGEVPIIIATNQIFGEGADVPKIDAIVNAEGNKSSISALQKVGRSLRLNPEDGKQRSIVIDFEDEPITNKAEGNHHEIRKNIYIQNSAFVHHDKAQKWEEIKKKDDLKSTSAPHNNVEA